MKNVAEKTETENQTQTDADVVPRTKNATTSGTMVRSIMLQKEGMWNNWTNITMIPVTSILFSDKTGVSTRTTINTGFNT